MTKAVKDQAKEACKTAVKNVITAPMKKEVKDGMEKEVVPDVKSQAKTADKAQTTEVMNRFMPKIHLHAAIPVEGLLTLKSWMEKKNVKPTAVKEATEKGRNQMSAKPT